MDSSSAETRGSSPVNAHLGRLSNPHAHVIPHGYLLDHFSSVVGDDPSNAVQLVGLEDELEVPSRREYAKT
jgi:hypothetical protein